MSFLTNLQNQKKNLKSTETVVTKEDGKRFVEVAGSVVHLRPNEYGFVVDTKPDDVPVLIVDSLYIGAQDCVAGHILKSYDIRNVVSVGIEINIDCRYMYVDCLDLPESDIKPVLNKCLPFIKECMDFKENILVHCNAGVSRTSMVAIAYLMLYKSMNYMEAYSLVKEKRPAVQPNVGFVRQLKLLKITDLNL